MYNNDQQPIVGAVLIAGLMIAGAILLKGNTTPVSPPLNNSGPEIVSLGIRPVDDKDHILGSKTAKVVIVEYSDTECPFCKSFQSTLQQIKKERADVAWVYRHYPIPQLHSKAEREAEATECAFEQGGNTAFWKYLDRIFEITPSNNGLDEKELMNIADYTGLNSSAFYTCLQSGKYKDKVQADIRDAEKAGAAGTPSSVILTQKEITEKMQKEIMAAVNNPDAVSFGSPQKNAMRLNGALPLEMVNDILDILLK